MHPSPESRDSRYTPLPFEVCLLPPSSCSLLDDSEQRWRKGPLPLFLKTFDILDPRVLDQDLQCFEIFWKVEEADASDSQIVGHLSPTIFTGKHSQMSASLGWGWAGWEIPEYFCHGDELGSFLCPILGCISSHLHLLVWGLPVHWQNVYLAMPFFQAGACLFPKIHLNFFFFFF